MGKSKLLMLYVDIHSRCIRKCLRYAQIHVICLLSSMVCAKLRVTCGIWHVVCSVLYATYPDPFMIYPFCYVACLKPLYVALADSPFDLYY